MLLIRGHHSNGDACFSRWLFLAHGRSLFLDYEM